MSADERHARFIDFAHHGGCSQKLSSSRLQSLLRPLQRAWSDAGLAEVGGEVTASSVDVVLPMIDDPALFGRIVTNHVLSDLYAVGVEPVFALNILGVPDGLFGAEGLTESEIDDQVQKMLVASGEALKEAGAAQIGGHTLAFDVLFFGMAATGIARSGRTVNLAAARPGDSLVLTKPLGTSVATKAWKMGDASPHDADDVLRGMLQSNRTASTAMIGLSRCGCTDISGFGLLGHLRYMLEASGLSARLRVADVPIYPSAREAVTEGSPTRIFSANEADVAQYVHDLVGLTGAQRLFLMDAQVSGGLLIAMPPSEVAPFIAKLKAAGEQAWDIGEIGRREQALITLE